MSSNYLVYLEDEDKPALVTPDFADALYEFLKGVINGDSAELKWSA